MSNPSNQQHSPGNDSPGGEKSPGNQYLGRKLAEWVSLGISTVLVVGVAGYLIYLTMQSPDPYASLEITPQLQAAQELAGQFVVPIEVANKSPRTLRELKIEVEYRPSSAEPEKREFTIGFLGGGARKTVYAFFSRLPNEGELTAQPQVYQLD